MILKVFFRNGLTFVSILNFNMYIFSSRGNIHIFFNTSFRAVNQKISIQQNLEKILFDYGLSFRTTLLLHWGAVRFPELDEQIYHNNYQGCKTGLLSNENLLKKRTRVVSDPGISDTLQILAGESLGFLLLWDEIWKFLIRIFYVPFSSCLWVFWTIS